MNVHGVTESELHLLKDTLDFLCEQIRDENSDVVMKVNKFIDSHLLVSWIIDSLMMQC